MFGICGAGAIGRLWAYRLGSARCRFLSTRANEAIEPSSVIRFDIVDAKKADEIAAHRSISFININDKVIRQSIQKELSAVLICTKSYHAMEAALELNNSLPTSIPFILFQNGLGSQQRILERIVSRPVFAATTTSGANINPANQLVLAGDGDTLIGGWNEIANAKIGIRLADELNQERKYSLSHTDEIERLLWRKLLINCGINAFTALENVRNGEICKTPTFNELWKPLIDELCILAPNAGLSASPDKLESMILGVAKSTKNNISSMLQDVRAGKQTEIDDINGYASRAIEQLGFSAPANLALTRRVHALRN